VRFSGLATLLLVIMSSPLPTLNAQNGWRMSGYNGSRTNSTPVAGPPTQPVFQPLISNAPGSLSRIGPDGSLLLYDGVNLNYYSSAGAPKWTTNVGSIADVAIGPSGTIYTSTSTTLSAWSATTGASAWSQPYTVNTGNETSALAIDSHETVYMVSGASFVGPPGKVTAINADGSLKWDNQLTFRGYEQFVLSTDESLGYIMDLTSTSVGNQTLEHAVSTANGQDVYSITSFQDLRDNTYGFAPWNVLYTGQYSGQLVGCSLNFSSCTDVSTGGSVGGIVTLTAKGLIVVPYGTGVYAAITQSGTVVWTSTETLSGGFSDGAGTLYAFAPNTTDLVATSITPTGGQELWRQHFTAPGSSLLLGDDGNLYLTVGTTVYKSGPNAGTIQVTTNLPAASFSITGPTTYSGSGTSFTQANAPAGVYTITFGPVAGYSAPASQTQTLAASGTISFSGTYQSLTGSISVTTNLASATFTITGPATYSGTGTSFAQTNAPAGAYTITYSAVNGYATPASQTLSLAEGSTISFSGVYTLVSGAINVTTNLAAATFSITGPTTYTGSGTSFSQPNAPAGAYTIKYAAVPGYTSPASQTLTLSPGGTITFTGTYISAGIGTIQVTTNLPTATFDLKGPASYSGRGPSSTFRNAPTGSYTITYNAVAGYSTPPPQTQTLLNAGLITFSGRYLPSLITSLPSLSFQYVAGQTAPIPSQALTVTLSNNGQTTVAVNVSNGNNWLMVTPPAGTTPARFAVSINPVVGPGVYSGTLRINDSGASNSPITIPVSLTVTLPQAQEYRVIPASINTDQSQDYAEEPSLAIDPNNNQHLVIGYSALHSSGDRKTVSVNCGFIETLDGGKTWINSGVIPLPSGYSASGNPWVIFSSQGDLFYSCMANSTARTGAYIAHAANGRVGSLKEQVKPIVDMAVSDGKNQVIVDHPSLASLPSIRGGSRVVACWTEVHGYFPNTVNSFLLSAYSDDGGSTWSLPQHFSATPLAQVCMLGSGSSGVALTWWEQDQSALMYQTSVDGSKWSAKNQLSSVGLLVPQRQCEGSGCAPINTTDLVVSPPYAAVFSTSAGLSATWQMRKATGSDVLMQPLTLTPRAQPASVGDPLKPTFLPAAGQCGLFTGSYQTMADGNHFSYSVWANEFAAPSTPIFTSSFQLVSGNNPLDLLNRGYRIGDYTAIGCSSTSVWAAWMDTRSQVGPGLPEIWLARISR